MRAPLRRTPGLGPRHFSRFGRVPQSHKAKGLRRSLFASNPNGLIENASTIRGFKSGQDIEGAAVSAEPARSFPGRTHDDIGALFQNMRQGTRMHETAIRDGDIPFNKGSAAEALAALLIGQLNEAEAFGGQIYRMGAIGRASYRVKPQRFAPGGLRCPVMPALTGRAGLL